MCRQLFKKQPVIKMIYVRIRITISVRIPYKCVRSRLKWKKELDTSEQQTICLQWKRCELLRSMRDIAQTWNWVIVTYPVIKQAQLAAVESCFFHRSLSQEIAQAVSKLDSVSVSLRPSLVLKSRRCKCRPYFASTQNVVFYQLGNITISLSA